MWWPRAENEKHIVRQVKEMLRAKAGMLLLEAAETGATFMLPRLLDKGMAAASYDCLCACGCVACVAPRVQAYLFPPSTCWV